MSEKVDKRIHNKRPSYIDRDEVSQQVYVSVKKKLIKKYGKKEIITMLKNFLLNLQ